MKRPIEIGIADDHDIVRQGYASLLENEKGIRVVLDAANGEELINKLKKRQPDIILLDIEMPVMNGKNCLKVIAKSYPSIKVIILSAYYSETFITEYIQIGAAAFLPKRCQFDTLVQAITTVYKSGRYFDEQITSILSNRTSNKKTKSGPEPQLQEFSEKEMQILKLVVENKTNTEIAKILGLAERTVEWYKLQLMKKTNEPNISGLILFAIKYKLVQVNQL